MTDQHHRYEVDLTRAARRALAEQLPMDVVMGVADFLAGPLADNPQRVGKPLNPPLGDKYSARLMREYRLLYTIDEQQRRVNVESIRHRRDAYRSP
ncbi:type II toxin-antitoxin system RelE/ParE family toxin [Crossiella sp. SN42]|uniref:type II toxin-antitoxin system RelE family toxin n=1 Tax=Crossiella sp. SN42 TaxID=2944808 RepID=UPI00207C872E|nr:type II toxin-antitoxin system RelE/ParE family toxin [Crossiella sp. SN42]MCO1579927.1 type II toxin-antitoxin system RelE/ParE family toxin [Crossiella sp. SN42]